MTTGKVLDRMPHAGNPHVAPSQCYGGMLVYIPLLLVLLSVLPCWGGTYWWTGAANETGKEKPSIATVGNWADENGVVPAVAPGEEDTLVFTNAAGTIYAVGTGQQNSKPWARYGSIILRDAGSVQINRVSTDPETYPCIPTGGIWNYTDNGVLSFTGKMKTVPGTTSLWTTGVVYVADSAQVLHTGIFFPQNYSVVVKRGKGLYQVNGGALYNTQFKLMVEAGIAQLTYFPGTGGMGSYRIGFAGDDPSATIELLAANATNKLSNTSDVALDDRNSVSTGHTLTDGGRHGTLHLNGKGNTVFNGVLAGTLSLIWDPSGGTEVLELKKGKSTSTGSLEVLKGKVRICDGADYSTLSSVSIADGLTFVVEDATLAVGTLVSGDSTTIKVAPADNILKATSWIRGGTEMTPGFYDSSSGVGIIGAGTILVPPQYTVEYDPANKTSAPVDATTHTAITHAGIGTMGLIEIALSSAIAIPDVSTNRIEVARFASESGLVAEDFKDTTPKTHDLPVTWFETMDDGSTIHVYLVSRPVIAASYTEKGTRDGSVSPVYDPSYCFMTEGDKAMWTDNAVPHGGADYLISPNDTTMTIFSDENAPATTFPGESLTIVAARYNMTRLSANYRFIHMNAANRSSVFCQRGSEMGGEIFVSDELNFVVDGVSEGTTLNAPIRGPGNVSIFRMWSGTQFCIFRLYGDNSGLAGRFSVKGYVDSSRYCDMRAYITNALALGGPMASATPNGITFSRFPCLYVRGATVIDAANRHIYADDGLRISVSENVVFAIKNPYHCHIGYSDNEKTFIPDRCCLQKTGAGTLALGARVVPCGTDFSEVAVDGTNNLVRVREGGISPLAADAFDNLAVSFSNATAIVVDPTNGATAAHGLRMMNSAPSFESGAKVELRVVDGYVPVPNETVAFLTVPGTSPDLTTHLHPASMRSAGRRMCGKIVAENIMVGDIACTRYSVNYRQIGFIIAIH